MATKAVKTKPIVPRGYGAPVLFAVEDVAESSGPVWIQVAREGKWEGHPSGVVVDFTPARFSQIIENFHAHPWYTPGADGVGSKRVVPYDYDHASEMSPAEGSKPAQGAPAPAWALELELRPGDGGKQELWAYTELSDQAREQIRAGGYISTSVAVWPNHKDPVTNKPIGAVLTSIAFTNKPFIQGMAPIAASVSVYGKAESVEEVIVALREMLGLPSDCAPAEVAVELQQLGQAVAKGQTGAGYPDGYGYLVDRIRQLLGLRVLATTDEILNTAGQLIVGVADTTAPAPQPALEDQTMNAPGTAAPALAAFAGALADLLNCRDSEPVLLAAVKEVKAKGDTLDQLLGLFESDEMTSLLGDAAKTIEKAKKADEYLAGLTAARDRLGKTETATAETETEQIAASMGLTGDNATRFKPLLLSARLACNPVYGADCVKPEDFKKADEAAALRLTNFRTTYPMGAIDPRAALLSQSLVAGPGGQQILAATPGQLPAAAPAPGTAPQHVLLFAAYPGRNDIEKCVAYHKDKTPGFNLQPYQAQVRAASAFVRTGQLAL